MAMWYLAASCICVVAVIKGYDPGTQHSCIFNFHPKEVMFTMKFNTGLFVCKWNPCSPTEEKWAATNAFGVPRKMVQSSL